jgi:hypothetical protein
LAYEGYPRYSKVALTLQLVAADIPFENSKRNFPGNTLFYSFIYSPF